MKPESDADMKTGDRGGAAVRGSKGGGTIAAPGRVAAEAVTIEPATDIDMPLIAALLQDADLPNSNLQAHQPHFFVARVGDEVVGAVGAEVNGPDALLRSLVVAPSMRRAGVGQRLLGTIEAAAAKWGVERWWLLTTTAERFFSARGFHVASRASAPATIQHTRQFSGGCCALAVCMTRERRPIR